MAESDSRCATCRGLGWVRESDGSDYGYRDRVPCPVCAPVTVRMSRAAAVFLVGTVEHLNQAKVLPGGDAEALQTSAWLEEIEAKTRAALA